MSDTQLSPPRGPVVEAQVGFEPTVAWSNFFQQLADGLVARGQSDMNIGVALQNLQAAINNHEARIAALEVGL